MPSHPRGIAGNALTQLDIFVRKEIRMKSSVLFVCFLAPFIVRPAEAVDASSCAARAAHLKSSERSAYMKSCLAQVSSPANVREAELRHKRALCAQNAKNYKMQGNNRENYIATCINRNEAESAAKTVRNQINASKKAGKISFSKPERPTQRSNRPHAATNAHRNGR
jgi:hypothetical protein